MPHFFRDEVPFLIDQWARWARTRTGLRLGYSRIADYRGSTAPEPLIDDDTALWVDAAIAKIESERARDALVLRCVVGATEAMLAIELGCCRKTAQRLVEQGLHEVGEQLAA